MKDKSLSLQEEAIKILKNELKVDLGNKSFNGDVTTRSLISEKDEKEFFVIPRQQIVVCGLDCIPGFISRVTNKIHFNKIVKDGDLINKNQIIAKISGNSRQILSLERTILNFIQHLSAISTATHLLVKKLNKSKTKLLDTRKTTTGLRKLEKYATKKGGAINHRLSLDKKILIKDNHILVCGGIDKVLKKLKKKRITDYQIECDNFSQVQKLLNYGCKNFLLDNMSPKDIKKSLKLATGKNANFEISGGINVNNIHKFANLGANFISSGAITQGCKSVDIGLDIF